MPSLFKAREEDNSAGTFVCKTEPCNWSDNLDHFHRCHLSCSFSKEFWNCAGIRFAVCNGAHTRGSAFKHVVLLAVTFDGNNQLVTLAFAIVPVEDSNNWVWFKEHLDADLPGCNVWMPDADEGIRSNAFSLSVSQTLDEFVLSRCARHLSENCRESCESGAMNEDHKRAIVELAKTRTWDQHNVRLNALGNEQWQKCPHERKHEFATASFLERGHRRFGKVTSNGVKNINGALAGHQCLPIVAMTEEVVKHQREKFLERKEMALKWEENGKELTPFAFVEDIRIGEQAAKRDVEMLDVSGTVHKACTSSQGFTGGSVEASVDARNHCVHCPCEHCEELGMPCVHMKALLLRIGSVGGSKHWCHKRHHVTTCSQSDDARVPGCTTAGKLVADETPLPPEHRHSAGHPAKKRKD